MWQAGRRCRTVMKSAALHRLCRHRPSALRAGIEDRGDSRRHRRWRRPRPLPLAPLRSDGRASASRPPPPCTPRGGVGLAGDEGRAHEPGLELLAHGGPRVRLPERRPSRATLKSASTGLPSNRRRRELSRPRRGLSIRRNWRGLEGRRRWTGGRESRGKSCGGHRLEDVDLGDPELQDLPERCSARTYFSRGANPSRDRGKVVLDAAELVEGICLNQRGVVGLVDDDEQHSSCASTPSRALSGFLRRQDCREAEIACIGDLTPGRQDGTPRFQAAASAPSGGAMQALDRRSPRSPSRPRRGTDDASRGGTGRRGWARGCAPPP